MTELRQDTFIPEKPSGKAIIICERVITDADTQNKTLVSTFNKVTAKHFPCKHDRLAVYVALTDSSGTKHVELRFKNEAREQPLLKLSGDVLFPHPNAVVELIFEIRNILLPQPGMFTFEIFADGEYIFDVRFEASQI